MKLSITYASDGIYFSTHSLSLDQLDLCRGSDLADHTLDRHVVIIACVVRVACAVV